MQYRGWLAVGLLALALVAGRAWQLSRRLHHPPRHHAELYANELAGVRERCLPPKPELESYCRDHATLLLDDPECDADCVTLVRQVRGEPTR